MIIKIPKLDNYLKKLININQLGCCCCYNVVVVLDINQLHCCCCYYYIAFIVVIFNINQLGCDRFRELIQRNLCIYKMIANIPIN